MSRFDLPSRNLPKWKSLENIPQELKKLKQWVCFKAVRKEGHWGKQIFSPVTDKFAEANNPNTWTDFQSALDYAIRNDMDGLTFALSGGIVFIDIDDMDSQTEEVQDELSTLCEELNTYCESSVSGKGLHFLCKGELPPRARKKCDAKGLEMYDKLRFVCMTGNVIDGCREIRDLSDKIADINCRYLGKPYEEHKVERRIASNTDTEIIQAIRNSKQSSKFDRLYSGDWSDYDSQSSADFALVRILTYWTQDEAQIDSIFRTSGLYRPKWDKSGGYYGKRTIDQALRVTYKTRRSAIEM